MKISNYALAITCISLLAALALIGIFFDPNLVSAPPADNQNVTVRLNVTNTEPTIYAVGMDDSIGNPAGQVVLTAGETREVYCNASARDFNGQEDIHNATARIFASGTGKTFFDADEKASHYTNSTCREFVNVAGTTQNRTFTCRFLVDYFAFSSTWTCNITVRDFGGTQIPSSKLFLNATSTTTTTFNELIAINLTKTSIDYGNLSVTETAAEETINITNAGNVRTNFTTLGYGGLNKSSDLTNLNFTSMLCEEKNISIGQHRYSNVTGATWPNMINLTHNATIFRNVTLQNRTSETDPMQPGARNDTYWRIRVPLSVGGLCNGTIEFAATSLSW